MKDAVRIRYITFIAAWGGLRLVALGAFMIAWGLEKLGWLRWQDIILIVPMGILVSRPLFDRYYERKFDIPVVEAPPARLSRPMELLVTALGIAGCLLILIGAIVYVTLKPETPTYGVLLAIEILLLCFLIPLWIWRWPKSFLGQRMAFGLLLMTAATALALFGFVPNAVPLIVFGLMEMAEGIFEHRELQLTYSSLNGLLSAK